MAAITKVTSVQTNSTWIANAATVTAILADLPNQGTVPGLADIPGSGIVKVVLKGNHINGQLYNNTVHLAYANTTAATVEKSADLIADLLTHFVAAITPALIEATGDFLIEKFTAYVLDVVSGDFLPVGEDNINLSGLDLITNPMPAQLAASIDMKTSVTNLYGGFFWGGLSEGHNGTDGELKVAGRDLAANLAHAIANPATWTNYTFYGGIWSPTKGTFGTYRRLSVDNLWDTIRKRKADVGA